MKFAAARAMLSSCSESEENFLSERNLAGVRNRDRRLIASSSSTGQREDELSTDVYDQAGHLIRRAQQIAVAMFYSTMGNEVTPVQDRKSTRLNSSHMS